MRPQKFENCLNAAIRAGIDKIVIGYDGPKELLDVHRKIVKKYFRYASIHFCTYPFNAGISKVRNSILQFVNTKYLLQLDDDVIVPRNVLDIIPFLDEHDELGGVGMGQIPLSTKCLPLIEAFDMEIIDEYLFRTFNNDKYYQISNGLVFMGYFDFIPNNAIFRKELFNDVKWDNNFVIWGDNSDFFLQAKYHTKWKFAVCTSLYLIHEPGGSKKFEVYRSGIESIKAKHYFFKKWDIKGMIPNTPVPYLLDGNTYFHMIIKQNRVTMKKLRTNKILQKDCIGVPNKYFSGDEN